MELLHQHVLCFVFFLVIFWTKSNTLICSRGCPGYQNRNGQITAFSVQHAITPPYHYRASRCLLLYVFLRNMSVILCKRKIPQALQLSIKSTGNVGYCISTFRSVCNTQQQAWLHPMCFMPMSLSIHRLWHILRPRY